MSCIALNILNSFQIAKAPLQKMHNQLIENTKKSYEKLVLSEIFQRVLKSTKICNKMLEKIYQKQRKIY